MRRTTLEQTRPGSGRTPLAARQTSRVLGLRETLVSYARGFPFLERRPRGPVVLRDHLPAQNRLGGFLPQSTAPLQLLSHLVNISSLPRRFLRSLRSHSVPLRTRMGATLLWIGIVMIVTLIPKESFQIRNRSTPQRRSGNALSLMTRRWSSTLRSLRWHRNHRNLSHYKMMPCWEVPSDRHSLAQSFPRPRSDFGTSITTRKLCEK